MKKTFIEWLKTPNSKYKIIYFEYFVYILLEKINKDDWRNLNRTNILNLLLYTINSSDLKNEPKLLEVFDSWYSTPLSLVESDLYKYIKNNDGKFSFFEVDRFGIKVNSKPDVIICDEITNLIDSCVKNIIKNGIIKRNTNYLSDLIRKHDAWIYSYRNALYNNKYSHPIDKNILINENKYFIN